MMKNKRYVSACPNASSSFNAPTPPIQILMNNCFNAEQDFIDRMLQSVQLNLAYEGRADSSMLEGLSTYTYLRLRNAEKNLLSEEFQY